MFHLLDTHIGAVQLVIFISSPLFVAFDDAWSPSVHFVFMLSWYPIYGCWDVNILSVWFPIPIKGGQGMVQWWKLSHWVIRSWVRSSLSVDFTKERLVSVYPFPRPHSRGSLSTGFALFFIKGGQSKLSSPNNKRQQFPVGLNFIITARKEKKRWISFCFAADIIIT